MKNKLCREILRICLVKLPNHPFFNFKEGKLHYTFIIQDNSIISIGTNQLGPRRLGWPDHSNIHSEYIAFKHAKRILNVGNEPFDVVNIRMNRNGELRNSKPCNACLAYLKRNKVNKIWYTDINGKFTSV